MQFVFDNTSFKIFYWRETGILDENIGRSSYIVLNLTKTSIDKYLLNKVCMQSSSSYCIKSRIDLFILLALYFCTCFSSVGWTSPNNRSFSRIKGASNLLRDFRNFNPSIDLNSPQFLRYKYSSYTN